MIRTGKEAKVATADGSRDKHPVRQSKSCIVNAVLITLFDMVK